MSDTVLIVDDDAFMVDIIKFYLMGAGYKVIEANDAKQALKLITQSKPRIDLILTDLHMPFMNGVEFAHTLKNATEYSNVPMVLITSDTEAVAKFTHDVQYKVFNDSISKPIIAAEMLGKIQQLLIDKQVA